MTYDTEWSNIRKAYRTETYRVLNDLYNGHVDEEDLDKLNNFIAVSLMLMAKSNLPTWRKAEKEAELAAFIKHENVEKTDD
jgi:hypothetical protein